MRNRVCFDLTLGLRTWFDIQVRLQIFYPYYLVSSLSLIVLAGLVTLIRFGIDWQVVWWLIQLSLGILIAGFLPHIDRLLFAFWTRPEDPFSQQVKALWSQKRYRDIFSVLVADLTQFHRLVTNSLFFLIAWVVIGVMIITASVDAFALGYIFGMGLMILTWMNNLRPNWDGLAEQLYWPIARKPDLVEIKLIYYSTHAFFLVLLFLGLM